MTDESPPPMKIMFIYFVFDMYVWHLSDEREQI